MRHLTNVEGRRRPFEGRIVVIGPLQAANCRAAAGASAAAVMDAVTDAVMDAVAVGPIGPLYGRPPVGPTLRRTLASGWRLERLYGR